MNKKTKKVAVRWEQVKTDDAEERIAAAYRIVFEDWPSSETKQTQGTRKRDAEEK